MRANLSKWLQRWTRNIVYFRKKGRHEWEGGDINTVGLKNYRNQITRGRELEGKEIVVREWTSSDWDDEKIVIIGYEKLYGVYIKKNER